MARKLDWNFLRFKNFGIGEQRRKVSRIIRGLCGLLFKGDIGEVEKVDEIDAKLSLQQVDLYSFQWFFTFLEDFLR